MSEIKIIVTGAGGGSIGEQVTKSLRNGSGEYFIVTTDTREDSIAKCLGDDFSVLPFANDPDYITRLLSLCEAKQCKLVIPGSEPELRKIAESIARFHENSIYVPINSLGLIDLCSDKLKFQEFLSAHDFNTCETRIVDSSLDMLSLNKFPYILKPVKGSGSKNVFIVQTTVELSAILGYLKDEGTVLIQEYVGSGDDEYTIGILSTPTGYEKHITLKRDLSHGMSVKQKVKNNTGKVSLGHDLIVSTGISQGKFVSNALLDKEVMKLVEILKPTSTLNMQCRIQGDQVFIFEINPRFSGTSNLRALVGFNEPEFLINHHFSFPNAQLDEKNWKGKTVLRGIQEFLIT